MMTLLSSRRGTYSEEIMREFYASYAATLHSSISKQSKPLSQMGHRAEWRFPRNAEKQEAVLLWLARVSPTKAAIKSRGTEWSWLRHWNSGVPIWHCDKLVHPTGALDISLIQDEANVAAPRRELQVEVPLLGADLANTVGKAQGDDISIPAHTDTVPGSSSQAASMAPSLSRSTPQLGATVVPLARVQKLEA
ncbi:hypothetical protein H5410_060928 [Solanum commersonii]|uniref:Integrase core domain containing protein n=1 Tax=Solanum commersonii TaxID=4109 RepID=A0A9J5W6K0_SOLCO|nr:hypothetical protein H5410_060928 [Solanum commersonii]